MIMASTDDLAQHRARDRLEQLVDHAQAQRRRDRAGELADAAEHHDHERVDDVALPELRADVAELRERDAAQTRDARAEAEHPACRRARCGMPQQAAMPRFWVTART